jgi:hypothetical protein
VIAVEQKPNIQDALEEMQELLRTIALVGSPPRHSAVRYTLCRSALIESELEAGPARLLVQCVSASKFHDFIHLYDPKAEARIAFVDAAFSACRARLDAKRIYDVFSDPD